MDEIPIDSTEYVRILENRVEELQKDVADISRERGILYTCLLDTVENNYKEE